MSCILSLIKREPSNFRTAVGRVTIAPYELKTTRKILFTIVFSYFDQLMGFFDIFLSCEKLLVGYLFQKIEKLYVFFIDSKIYVRRGGPNYREGLNLMQELSLTLGVPIEVSCTTHTHTHTDYTFQIFTPVYFLKRFRAP